MTPMLEKLERLRKFTLHVRNCYELGPHPLRAEGVMMTQVVEECIELEKEKTVKGEKC